MLDSLTEHVPTDQPVIIIELSYEGIPVDNAKKFLSRLENLDGTSTLKSVQYPVFGVVNSDWFSSYHRTPRLTDELPGKLGAKHFLDSGFVDVKSVIVGPWETWTERLLFSLRGAGGSTSVSSHEGRSAAISPPQVCHQSPRLGNWLRHYQNQSSSWRKRGWLAKKKTD